MRLGILVSGRGSNLEAVLDAIGSGRLPGVEAALVIANRPGIRALEVAARSGVPWRLLARDDFSTGEARDEAIGHALAESACDMALLAGYDQVLGPAYFAAFAGRTINIHPSLLPLHGGRGMVGLAVHAAVLAAGVALRGDTTNVVRRVLAAGPTILLIGGRGPPRDSPADLADRVLEVEHQALVEVLRQLSGSMTAASPAPIRARR